MHNLSGWEIINSATNILWASWGLSTSCYQARLWASIDSSVKLLWRFQTERQGKRWGIRWGASFRGTEGWRNRARWNTLLLWGGSNFLLWFLLLINNDHISSIIAQYFILLLVTRVLWALLLVLALAFQLFSQGRSLFFLQGSLRNMWSLGYQFQLQKQDSWRRIHQRLPRRGFLHIHPEDFWSSWKQTLPIWVLWWVFHHHFSKFIWFYWFL